MQLTFINFTFLRVGACPTSECAHQVVYGTVVSRCQYIWVDANMCNWQPWTNSGVAHCEEAR